MRAVFNHLVLNVAIMMGGFAGSVVLAWFIVPKLAQRRASQEALRGFIVLGLFTAFIFLVALPRITGS